MWKTVNFGNLTHLGLELFRQSPPVALRDYEFFFFLEGGFTTHTTHIGGTRPKWVKAIIDNTLRPRQYGRHLPDDIFKCIFLNEKTWISITILLKFAPKVPINNIQALDLIMAWRRTGDKPLSEPMMISLLTHICVSRPQWVKATRVKMWIVKPPYSEPYLCGIKNDAKSSSKYVIRY